MPMNYIVNNKYKLVSKMVLSMRGEGLKSIYRKNKKKWYKNR